MIAATKMFGLFILLLLVLAMHLVPSVVAQSLRSHDRGTSNQPANTRVMKQSSNIQGENDEVFSPLSSSKNETDQNVFYGTPKSAMKSDRNSIFANLASIESFKASQPSLWSTSHNGRLTLSKLHYVILPVWYADETQTAFDASTTAAIMRRVAAFYQQMSYGKFKLSWEILDPFPLTGITKGNPSLGSVQIAAEAHVKNLGLVNPIDYDGVITMYNQAQAGDLANGGGWGTSNGT